MASRAAPEGAARASDLCLLAPRWLESTALGGRSLCLFLLPQQEGGRNPTYGVLVSDAVASTAAALSFGLALGCCLSAARRRRRRTRRRLLGGHQFSFVEVELS